MHLWVLSLPMVLAAVPVEAPAVVEPARSRWEINGAASSGTPAALDHGLSLGATAEGKRRLYASPVFVSARLGWAAASAANTSWIIDHDQFTLALGVGVTGTLGAGHVWAQVGAGASGLREVLSSHQLERITMAQVPGGRETSFQIGPYAFGDLGVGVRLRGATSGFVAVGPTATRSLVDGSALVRVGLSARLGVAHAF